MKYKPNFFIILQYIVDVKRAPNSLAFICQIDVGQ